ncbi:MAG: STAS domain-containing protein [Acidobacteria bacterium]|nr:STAS domain-containing protein [Acidobacteriota bacterium]
MPITVQSRTAGSDVTVLAIKGRMHLGTQLQDLEENVRKQVASGCRKLVLDLSEVEYVDSAALGMLMMGYGTMQEAGGKLHIAGTSERVLGTMRIAHADKVLPLFPDADQAVAAFLS